MKKILFVVHSRVHFRLMSEYILNLSRGNDYIVNVYFEKVELEEYAKDLPKTAILHRGYNQKEIDHRLNRGVRESKFKSKLLLPLKYAVRTIRNVKMLTTGEKKAKKLLEITGPHYVILSSNRYEELQLQLANECNKHKIKTAIVGVDYLYLSSFEGYANMYFREPISKSNLLDKLALKMFPKQAFDAFNEKYFFYNVPLIIALKIKGLLFDKPYITGSNNIDDIFVDCQKTKDIYIKEGISGKKVKVSGLIEHDNFNKSIINKNKLIEEFNENTNYSQERDTIIIGVPQLYEHNLLSESEHWSEIEYLGKTLSKTNQNVIFSLHPKMSREKYHYLEEKYNIIISPRPLHDVICIADIYICTYSSTALWGIILNKPVLLIDFYNIRYNLYNEFKAIKKFEDKALFEDYLKRITTNNKVSTSHRNLTAIDSKSLAKVDGKSYERFSKTVFNSINESC